MVAVQIADIDLTTLDPHDFLGGHIDVPVPGSEFDAHSIDLTGWILPRRSRPVLVKVTYNAIELVSSNVDVVRPDVAAFHRLSPGAQKCGYHMRVNLLGVGPDFELIVHVTLEDGQDKLLGRITGRQQRLCPTFGPQRNPLMVTSMGRTGTTWL